MVSREASGSEHSGHASQGHLQLPEYSTFHFNNSSSNKHNNQLNAIAFWYFPKPDIIFCFTTENCEFRAMSANTTASQHNGMEFPKDDDTADKKIQINTTPPLPVRKHQPITGNTKTLHRFGEFPREIQIKIFKLALPDPRIVHLGLEVIFSEPEDGITWVHARVNKIRAPRLLSLLETCITSNASVYSGDGFTKIKIQPLNSHPHTANKQRLSPNNNFCYKDWGDKVLNDTYMRFSEDILMVDYNRFDLLYRHGGSLDLERLTHIAVTRYLFDRHFESYRKEIEEEGNKNAIEYWNKVEVVNVLQCWPDGTQYDSSLYIPEIDSIVRSNDDGFLATLPESTPDSLIKLRDALKLVELGDGQ
ncbi:hypothetical protein BTUL_0006g00420 [Botrytis tulipae]|uniref:2EXR domain-containing protein n=1 Tax=Botrytis tulipae TaxID=87230 RepID=A0A4Z1F6E9_9HELO|nr:hypothetical protein BTUL_0006g00420 [Botrytis tulipae]